MGYHTEENLVLSDRDLSMATINSGVGGKDYQVFGGHMLCDYNST